MSEMSTVWPAPVSILMVDDRPDNLVALEAILEPLGVRLVKAASGLEALRTLMQEEFALILLDVQMPGMDGFEVAEAIKSHARLRYVPLIFLTAISKEIEHVFHGYQVGAVDYLSKPFDAEILLAKVRVFVDLYQKEKRLHAQDMALIELTQQHQELELAAVSRRAEAAEREAGVLASLNEGVFLLDAEGKVRLWNPAAERLFGLSGEEVYGRPLVETLPGWAQTLEVLKKEGAETQAAPIDIEEQELWLSFSTVDIPDGRIYLCRDLTDERRLERLKTDFVTTVSHELRTPLTSVYGAALTLQNQELDKGQQQQLLGVIATESARLSLLIDDIILAQRVDAGQAEADLGPVEVAPLVDKVIAGVSQRLPENLTLEIVLEEGLPCVQANASQLRQVLTNLVDNAIKYSPDGGVITVEAMTNGSKLRLGVRDQGLGVPAGEEKRIFDKFHRLDPHMQLGIGGAGLGLYISRQLVLQAEGRLWVEANPEGGSLFAVELPLAPT